MPLKTRIPEASGAASAICPPSIRSESAARAPVKKNAAKAATAVAREHFGDRMNVRIEFCREVERWAINDISASPATGPGLRAGTRHEAANLCVAVAIIVGPHNGRAEKIGLGYDC